jgi:tripartite-type tricarboxylate transporter receptor subunit TctC
VTTPARASILPNLPTISEAGVPGYAITLWIAIYAPAGTPVPIVARLNKEIAHALNLPAVREQMTLQGAEIAVGSPADLLAATKSDLKKMGELVKAAKIVAQ